MKKRKSIREEFVSNDETGNKNFLAMVFIAAIASSSFFAPTTFGSSGTFLNAEVAEVNRYSEAIPLYSKESTNTNGISRRLQYFEEVYEKCRLALPVEELVEVESQNYLEDILSFEKQTRTEDYNQLISYLINKCDLNLLRAVLNYIASLNYSEVTESEEDLITFCLFINDITTQESALNALLCLNNFSNVDRIESAFIDNKYLQDDLRSFINSLKEVA